MNASFWPCLARLPGGRALRTVWQSVFGKDFAAVQPFLRPTTDCAERVPCAECDCDHEVREDFAWELASVCNCGECEPRQLDRTATLVHALDQPALGEAVRQALGFAPTEARPLTADPSALEIGLHLPLHAPVYFFVPASEATLLREVESLIAARSGPFLLLTPTRHGFTPVVDAVLHRAASAALALTTTLDPAELVRPALPTSDFRLQPSDIRPPPSALSLQPSAFLLAPFLDAWAGRAANWRQSGQTLQHIHREIAAVRQDFTELRTAKQQLEKMLADGLFLFTQKVDATSFKVLCAILAEGDAAKAGRRLGFSDALVRYYLRQWAGRGVAYRTMLDLVRWRKQVGRKQTVPLNDAILHATAGATDYPGLLSDVLDGLLSMTDENWPDLCAELADLLRPAIAAANQPNAARPTPIRKSL